MDDFARIEREDNEVFNILAVGRLVKKKGFIVLLDALKILKKQGAPSFICNIIGDGEEKTRLEAAISSHGLEEVVHLLGAKKQEEVLAHMSKVDVFVLPCVAEANGSMDGIPVALMEAMAKGLPVISTTLSGIPELIDNGAGMLVPPEDADALADALSKLAGMSLNEKSQMGKRARQIVLHRFNISKEAKKLADLFTTS